MSSVANDRRNAGFGNPAVRVEHGELHVQRAQQALDAQQRCPLIATVRTSLGRVREPAELLARRGRGRRSDQSAASTPATTTVAATTATTTSAIREASERLMASPPSSRPPHRADRAGLAQLAAHLRHMDVDGPDSGHGGVAPDPADQLLAREHLPGCRIRNASRSNSVAARPTSPAST